MAYSPRSDVSSVLQDINFLKEQKKWDEVLQRLAELQHTLPSESPDSEDVTLEIADVSVSVAQELITRCHPNEANQYLTTADNMTGRALSNDQRNNKRLRVRALMYNSLTCLKKSQGNIRAALKCTEKALSILLHLNMLDQLPTCYLNICALYSAIGLHLEALKHAFLALQVIKQLMDITAKVASAPQNSKETSTLQSASGQVTADLPSAFVGTPQERISQLGEQLAITYFNIAVEQEYLLDCPSHLATYRVAINTAEEFLGVEHPLTQQFYKAYNKATKDDQKLRKGLQEDPKVYDKIHQRATSPTPNTSVNAVYAKQLRK